MTRLLTLAEVVTSPGSFRWGLALYLPKPAVWDEDTPCAVLDPDAVDEGDDAPDFARENGLTYALDIAAVPDVVGNARQQLPMATEKDLLRALAYYYEHDAFLDLG